MIQQPRFFQFHDASLPVGEETVEINFFSLMYHLVYNSGKKRLGNGERMSNIATAKAISPSEEIVSLVRVSD